MIGYLCLLLGCFLLGCSADGVSNTVESADISSRRQFDRVWLFEQQETVAVLTVRIRL